jgi:hypothetical protein
MYEYRSLRASTYDVDSLIDRLNGADGDGWEVVTVVPAGGDMVAIVRRPRGTADAAVAVAEEPAVVAAVAEVPVVAAEPEPEPVHTAPAVEEPAGWGAAPEPEGVAPVATSTYQPAAEVVEPMPMAESEPASDPATQVVPQVNTTPAGWYPDPSGRFELRYWNGTAWTEHVARGGQQYTDPPVA